MKTSIRIFSSLAVLAVITPYMVSAADKPATTTEPTKATEKATPGAPAKTKLTPLYAQVDSITNTLLTVKGTGPDLKFVINAETKISKDKAHKEPATTSDVKVGQWIGGSYSKAADGSNVLHSLHLAVAQKGEQPAKPTEKPKQ